MEPPTIHKWLRYKKTRNQRLNALLALVAFVGGIFALFLTFWFTYAIIWVGWYGISAISELIANKRMQMSHEWRLILSGVFVLLLIIQHLKTNPLHWGEYPSRDYVSAPGLHAHAGVTGALGTMLFYPGASANMIADILLVGPRLVTGSWNLWKQSRSMAQLDESGCATLLEFLASRQSAVSFDELYGAGWEAWLDQLRCIEGVIFLEKGLTLSEELRNELNNQLPT